MDWLAQIRQDFVEHRMSKSQLPKGHDQSVSQGLKQFPSALFIEYMKGVYPKENETHKADESPNSYVQWEDKVQLAVH